MSGSERFEGLNLAANFCQAWIKSEGTPSLLNSLVEDTSLLAEVVRIASGASEDFRYRIDCDSEPHSGQYAKVVSHVPQGQVVWDQYGIQLLAAEEELGRMRLQEGVAIHEWNHPDAANACFLDFFLRRPGVLKNSLIDQVRRSSRDSGRLLFSGTKYTCPGFDGAVRVLYREPHSSSGWSSEFISLGGHLRPSDTLVIWARK